MSSAVPKQARLAKSKKGEKRGKREERETIGLRKIILAARIIPSLAALRVAALPSLTGIRKTNSLIVGLSCRGDEHVRQATVDIHTLAAGRVVVLNHAHDHLLVVFDLDREAVVRGGAVAIAGFRAFVLLELEGGGWLAWLSKVREKKIV